VAFWLSSWANDNGGPVVGRQHNRLLVSLTTDDILLPAGLFQKGDLNGVNLFSLTLDTPAPGLVISATIATAIIDDIVTRINASDQRSLASSHSVARPLRHR